MLAVRPFRELRGCLHFCAATTLTCTASSVRFAWECIVGRREGALLTAGPVANMNLTRLNSNSGLYELTQSPSKADLTVHMRAEADTHNSSLAPHPITAVRASQGPARSQSSLPSDYQHYHHYQWRRLSMVDCTRRLAADSASGVT